MRFVDLTSSPADLLTLAQFYTSVYEPAFPDSNERESLENMSHYLQLRSQGWYGANNYHILLALLDNQVAAACICDYLHEANAGVLEFLLVHPDRRSDGLGRKMLAQVEQVLQDDARRAGHSCLAYVLGEMNDPFLTDPSSDNLDPFLRAQIWGKWGFAVIDFPYTQPALDPDKEPVTNLLLMAKPMTPGSHSSIKSETVRSAVHDYIRWAMRIDDPTQCAQYRDMAAHLLRHDGLKLTPLANYVGEVDGVRIERIETREQITALMPVYEANFLDTPEQAVSAEEFWHHVSKTVTGNERYSLWSLHDGDSVIPAGLASFFAFPWGGFGGYVALDSTLRGRKLLRPLMARMERQLKQDFPTAAGSWIECNPGGPENDVFAHLGYSRAEVDYRQPSLSDRSQGHDLSACPPLNLWYKPLGRVYAPPVVAWNELLAAMHDIHRHVYGVEKVDDAITFKHLMLQRDAASEATVPFHPGQALSA